MQVTRFKRPPHMADVEDRFPQHYAEANEIMEGMPFIDREADRIEGLQVEVDPPNVFLSIYDQRSHFGSELMTSLLVPEQSLPEWLRGRVPSRYIRGVDCRAVMVKTPLRLEVVPMTSERRLNHSAEAVHSAEFRLAEELRLLDARNMPRDRVFRDRRIGVELNGITFGQYWTKHPERQPPAEVRSRVSLDDFKLVPVKITVHL